jgi:hypothetical protein
MYCSEGMQECTVFFIDYTSAQKSEIAYYNISQDRTWNTQQIAIDCH